MAYVYVTRGSWVCDRGSRKSSCSREPRGWLKLCCCYLNILNNLSFNLCCANEVWWGNGAWMSAEETCTICGPAVACCLFADSVCNNPWAQNSGRHTKHGSSFSKTQNMMSMTYKTSSYKCKNLQQNIRKSNLTMCKTNWGMSSIYKAESLFIN